jgi:hypothetical protein
METPTMIRLMILRRREGTVAAFPFAGAPGVVPA